MTIAFSPAAAGTTAAATVTTPNFSGTPSFQLRPTLTEDVFESRRATVTFGATTSGTGGTPEEKPEPEVKIPDSFPSLDFTALAQRYTEENIDQTVADNRQALADGDPNATDPDKPQGIG